MLAQRNIPLAIAAYHSLMICQLLYEHMAKGYSCAQTKSTAILNNAVALTLKRELTSAMRSGPFSILVDGSNWLGQKAQLRSRSLILDAEEGS